ncbi:redoxin domain-containing protein [Geosporobacter ferrireducens]|uniref:Thioredoxin peroxidase n=1 Tax=Geosporobacter ferrireducens TaxID=1424294 RepID=A0A1D8GIQ0_9FIRM|nr:redoxin domain-containing protein [Geosporobacter ferrireducens]AOT70732.1 thioredoxin peroxidase [Geosporobacter ferrireducens]MTI57537.1 redoxin domain-containing protein [Geosporobacter ferrireducens]
MKPIAVGEHAPDFALMDQHENNIRLSDYKGRKVLLSWHPLAWTPVCTDQMRALENNWQAFQKLNTIPLGFSVDPQPSKKAWATAIVVNNVSLPSDFWPHGKVTQAYGLFNESQGASERANVIVDENGIIKWVKVYYTQELPDINEVLQVLSTM